MGRRAQDAEYDAFISYSRTESDFARVLEQALERFRPPSGLGLPRRPLRVFRDEEDLTGTEYFDAIAAQIGKSARMIVICTPEARKSRFVNDEITRFVETHGAAGLVPVLRAGLANNETGPGTEHLAAFPQALCDAMEMPLAIDYLDYRGGSDRVDRGRFLSAWYMLLSNILGRSRAEIEQRDLRRQRRRRRILAGITGGVMASLAALAVIAQLQRMEAEAQRALAEDNARRSMGLMFAARASEEIANDRPALALGWAGAAHAHAPELARTHAGMLKAFYLLRDWDVAVWEDVIGLDAPVYASKIGPGRARIVLGGGAGAKILDPQARTVRDLPVGKVWAVAMAADGRLAIGTEQDGVMLMAPRGDSKWRDTNGADTNGADTEGSVTEGGATELWRLAGFHASDLAFSGDGRRLVAVARSGEEALILDADGTVQRRVDLGPGTGILASVSAGPGGRLALIDRGRGDVRLLDLETGAAAPLAPGDVIAQAVFFEGGILAASETGLLWRRRDGGIARLLEGEEIHKVVPVGADRAFVIGLDNALIDLQGGEILAAFDPVPLDDPLAIGADVSSDGGLALVRFADAEGDVPLQLAEVWTLEDRPRRLAEMELGTHTSEVWFAPGDRHVMALGPDGVRRFSIAIEALEPRVARRAVEPAPLGFDTDDGFSVTRTAAATGVEVVSPAGRAPFVLDANAFVTGAPVLSDSRRFVLLGTKLADARLFDLADPAGLPVRYRPKGPEHFVEAVAISSDDALIALAGGTAPRRNIVDGRFVGVDVYLREANFEPVFSVPTGDRVLRLEFIEGDRYLRVATEDGVVTDYPLAGPIADWMATIPEYDWTRNAGVETAPHRL